MFVLYREVPCLQRKTCAAWENAARLINALGEWSPKAKSFAGHAESLPEPKEVNRIPSAEEVARVKARAFGKQITVGNAKSPGSTAQTIRSTNFLVNGRSSSFVFNARVRIRMHGTAKRNVLNPTIERLS
jgi:hypothetical protein